MDTGPGWYTDPEPQAASGSTRYWNGSDWTLDTRSPEVNKKRLRNRTILIFGVIVLIVGGYGASSLTKDDSPPAYRVHQDDGSGFAWASRIDSKWWCDGQNLVLTCGGGGGPNSDRMNIAPGKGSQGDLLRAFGPDDGMVVRYDSGSWSCASDGSGYTCTAR